MKRTVITLVAVLVVFGAVTAVAVADDDPDRGAVRDCLVEHGLGAPPLIALADGKRAEVRAAFESCGFVAAKRVPSETLEKFRACMAANGVELPAPGDRPWELRAPADLEPHKAALEACRDELPEPAKGVSCGGPGPPPEATAVVRPAEAVGLVFEFVGAPCQAAPLAERVP